MTLSSPLSEVKGVGPATAKLFELRGLFDIADLINYYPRRYDDYSEVTDIAKLHPGEVSIKASIKQIKGKYIRRGMYVTEAVASDKSGSVRLVWFNQPYREHSMKSGSTYLISGKFELSYQRMSIMNPSTELESDFPVNTARIIPIYPESKGLKSSLIRKTIREIAPFISKLPETLPEWVLNEQDLISRSDAVLGLHFPDTAKILEESKRRLGFEEVFELTLGALMAKGDNNKDHAPSIKFDEQLAKKFVANLPFKLTDDQKRVIWQIYQDIQKTTPMNRMIEGDVGSGKTVVAAMASLMAIKKGYQAAILAPTELLAKQHAESFYKLLDPLGMSENIALLVGSVKASQKAELKKRIADGSANIIIGTHALLQNSVMTKSLGLVVIDEQHRFGVEQRKKLQIQAGHMPHVLSMTATPIPRSLALTLYGEMDISIINTKPSDRLPIITDIVSPNSTEALHKTVDAQIAEGRQVFVVCPLIAESVDKDTKMLSAEDVFKQLKNGAFKHRKVGLLHGKMKGPEKTSIMQDFIDKKYDILVSTTVIEVGVDVPNASVMVIQNADRFGLAQLHQLRGRVGRSGYQGYCYAILSDSKAPSRRIKAFSQTSDGFKLSELDLEIRGPGAIYGTLQHGQLDLRIAKLSDTRLISSARALAQRFIDKNESLIQYKHLSARIKKARAITTLN